MEIRCKKNDCKHNTGCSCSAHKVEIDRGIECNSYVRDPLKKNLIRDCGNIFAVAEEKIDANVKSVPLACRAKSCLHNKEEKCHANGISVIDTTKKKPLPVGGGSDCAACATFCGK
jgi:hypothetical protein